MCHRALARSWSQAFSLNFIIPTVHLELMKFHLDTERHRHPSLLNSVHLPKSHRWHVFSTLISVSHTFMFPLGSPCWDDLWLNREAFFKMSGMTAKCLFFHSGVCNICVRWWWIPALLQGWCGRMWSACGTRGWKTFWMSPGTSWASWWIPFT